MRPAFYFIRRVISTRAIADQGCLPCRLSKLLAGAGQGGSAMKQIFDQFLQFLQQGIAAIFRFVQLIWTWSIDQITKVTQAPWEHWPLWKQILLFIVIAAVAYALFIAAKQLWVAGVHVLAAFASFLGALVVTLPTILVAGCIALAGLWVINNLNLSSLPSLTALQGGNTGSSQGGNTGSSSDSGNKQSGQTSGQGEGEAAGSKP
jgi:hypothetical protein